MSNNIKVICRFRPQNSLENKSGGVPVIEIDDNGETVKVGGKEFSGSFTFDRVFGMATSQQELYEYSIRSTVEDVFNGYNGTVFAYGQTGSGKTFTMMGADIDNPALKGIIPRIVENIFAAIVDSPPTIEYTVKVSYMEIYMEKIRDLLNPQNDNLPIHEEKNRGIYVKGLCEVYVSSVDEVYEVMKQGGNSRMVAYTHMNAESSRSHSIFVITITQKNLNDGKVKAGRLYLVDLAGSEKVGKTGASGQTLEEAKKINSSLSALGMVINALTDGKSAYIPYRDSKLTRILQESLGGNSRTTLIINCSPSSFNDAETVSTLRFGMRAKTIKNKAKVNQDLSPAELKKLLKGSQTREITFKAYIGLLEGEVKVWRTGGTVSPEQYATLERVKGGGALEMGPPAAAPVTPSRASQPTSSPTSPSMGARSSRAGTPVGLDSILSEALRPMTPAVALADDEREEFLKRENELTDQLAEKETELSQLAKDVEQMTEEVSYLKEESTALSIENKQVSHDLHHLRIQLDRANHANKEAQITLEGYKLSNGELTKDLADAKCRIDELAAATQSALAANGGTPSADSATASKQKLKEERMAQMMAEIDPAGMLTQDDSPLRNALAALSVDDASNGRETLLALNRTLVERSAELERQLAAAETLQRENKALSQRYAELETKHATLEHEFEDLLDRTIAEEEENADIDIAETIQELKHRLEAQYSSKGDTLQTELDSLRAEHEAQTAENIELRSSLAELKQVIAELKLQAEELKARPSEPLTPDAAGLAQRERDMEILKKSMMNKLREFEVMRKAMMRDLQLRCEKIIELEVALDETRDENHALRRKNVHSVQQQKTAILEKNIAQLVSIQKELVDQNTHLKKENAMAERKLAARNERIESLEAHILDTEERHIGERQRLESQIKQLKEKLGQKLAAKPNGASNPSSGMINILNFGRIAKPLRGGGGAPTSGMVGAGSSVSGGSLAADGSGVPNGAGVSPLASISENGTPTPQKRTSWLNWNR